MGIADRNPVAGRRRKRSVPRRKECPSAHLAVFGPPRQRARRARRPTARSGKTGLYRPTLARHGGEWSYRQFLPVPATGVAQDRAWYVVDTRSPIATHAFSNRDRNHRPAAG